METFFRDTRNNKLRKTNADGKSHKHGEDYFYMLKHYESLMKAKASVAQNLETLKNKEKESELTVDEFYTLVDWTKKAEKIEETESALIGQLCI